MEAFFDPRGIAVFGVSQAAGNLGERVIDNLRRWNYPGAIVAVGRRAGSVHGVPILPNADDADRFEGCDLAVIITPAATVPALVRRCAELGIRHIIVESSGFSEFGQHGSELDAELARAIGESGARVMGPNCIGVVQLATGNTACFAVIEGAHVPGDTALISQSGGVGLTTMRSLHAQSTGVGWLVSIGNKVDVDEVDVARFLLEEKPVGRLVCYLESMARGRAFCEVVARSTVPVIVHKVNRTAAAAQAAGSHTAALANDDAVLSAALEQAGAIRVQDTAELETAVHATRLPRLRSERIALLSRSGGHAVIAADSCADEGLVLTPLSAELCADLAAIQPESVIARRNPLDFGDVFDFDRAARMVARICEEPTIDGAVLVLLFNSLREAAGARVLVSEAVTCAQRLDKPIAIAVVTDHSTLAQLRSTARFPLFATPEQAVRALGLVWRREQALRRASGVAVTPPDLGPLPVAPTTPEDGAAQGSPKETAGVWSLARSLDLVARAGIPTVGQQLLPTTGAGTLHEEVLRRVPLVAKHNADTATVIHKARLGLVRRDIRDEAGVWQAARSIGDAAERLGLPRGDVVLQAHLSGPELFLGARRDPSFGPVVLFGCGGSLVELVDDVTICPFPFTLEQIEHGWQRTHLGDLVGNRLRPRQVSAWLAGLGAVLARMSAISEIDVNPVILASEGAQAVDARVVVSLSRPDEPR